MAAQATLQSKLNRVNKPGEPSGGGALKERSAGGTGNDVVDKGEDNKVMVRKQYWDKSDWKDEDEWLADDRDIVYGMSNRTEKTDSCVENCTEYWKALCESTCSTLMSVIDPYSLCHTELTDVDPYCKIELKTHYDKTGRQVGIHLTSPIIHGGRDVMFTANDMNLASFKVDEGLRETSEEMSLQVFVLDDDFGADYNVGFAQMGVSKLYANDETWQYLKVPVYEGGGDNYGGRVKLKARWIAKDKDNLEKTGGTIEVCILTVTDIKEQPGKESSHEESRTALQCCLMYGLLMFGIGPGIYLAIEPTMFPALCDGNNVPAGCGDAVVTDLDRYVKALWFVVVTITSVGYGDISPSNDGTKIFNVFFILGTFTLMGILFAIIVQWIMEMTESAKVKAKDAISSAVYNEKKDADDGTSPKEAIDHEQIAWADLQRKIIMNIVLVTLFCLIYGFGVIPGEMCNLVEEGAKQCASDLTSCNSGCAETKASIIAFSTESTIGSVHNNILNTTGSAGAAAVNAWMGAMETDCLKKCGVANTACMKDDESKAARAGADDGTCSGFFTGGADLVHYCIVSMSTVGYGDVNPQTGTGQFFAVFFLIFGVGLLAQTVGALMDVIIQAKNSKALSRMVDRQLGSIEELSQFDTDNDGKVTKFEFLYTILKITEEVPQTTLDMIVARFNAIDYDKNGYIDDADFQAMVDSGAKASGGKEAGGTKGADGRP